MMVRHRPTRWTEEDEPGVRCVGAPVFDENGAAVAAISVAGTKNEIGMDRVPILARQMMRTAQQILSRMGYIGQNLGVA